jgi:hypothetical protein
VPLAVVAAVFHNASLRRVLLAYLLQTASSTEDAADARA